MVGVALAYFPKPPLPAGALGGWASAVTQALAVASTFEAHIPSLAVAGAAESHAVESALVDEERDRVDRERAGHARAAQAAVRRGERLP